jgi:hypothetical protein
MTTFKAHRSTAAQMALAGGIVLYVYLQGALDILYGQAVQGVLGGAAPDLKISSLLDKALAPVGASTSPEVTKSKSTITGLLEAGAAVAGIIIVCLIAGAIISAMLGSRAGQGIQRVLIVFGCLIGIGVVLQVAA